MALCFSLAIRALQKFHLQRMDLELEPEDLVSLREEIEALRREMARKVKIDHNL